MADPAQAVFDLVNSARRHEGLQPLRRNTQLDSAARAHAHEMAQFQYFSHTGRDGQEVDARARRAGYMDGITSYGVGENIAKGYLDAGSVVTGWLNSPGHRANILYADYAETGVGWVVDSHEMPHWVQVFGFQWPGTRTRAAAQSQLPIATAPPLPPPIDFSRLVPSTPPPPSAYPAPPLPKNPWRKRQS